jgi:hypothetical protein
MPPLKDVNITATSKKDIVLKHRHTFQRIIEPRHNSGINSIDENLFKPEEQKLEDRAYLNAGPNF